jgi:uncharacterized protein
MNYITGKHIFLQHPYMQQESVEAKDKYYKRKKLFFEEADLLSDKEISFRDIGKKEIEKTIYDIQQVIFEVTEKCNLNCVYCTYGELYAGNEERIKEKRNLKKEDAFKLLEYLYPVWKEREQKGLFQKIMIGFYGGEPLLNFSIIEDIVQWAKKHTTKRLPFAFTLTTNGLLLDKYIDFLAKHDFIITLSFDGDEENMSYRMDHKGRNCFKRVFNNVMDVKKNHPIFFNKNVDFSTVLHNKNSVEQASFFCMTHFNKIPFCSNLNDNNIHPQKREQFAEINETSTIKLSKKTIKSMMVFEARFSETINFLRFFSGFNFYSYNSLLYKDSMNEVKRFPTGVCIPFSIKIYMTINGDLLPCERLESRFTMGNIHDTNILDTEQIAFRYNQYFKNILPVCTACERKFSCKKCLFHIEGIQGNKPQCKDKTDYAMFENMVSSVIARCKKHPELYRKIMKRKFSR